MKKIHLLSLALLVTSPAFAAESATSVTIPSSASLTPATTNTSSATIEAPSAGGLMDRAFAYTYSTYHGAALSDLGSSQQIDNRGNVSKIYRTNFDSEFGAGLKLTKDYGSGVAIPFLMLPSAGQHFILGDVGIRTYDKHAYSDRYLNIYAGLYLQAPTSDAAQHANMKLGVKAVPNIRYLVPQSNFRLGAWTEEKAYLGVNQGKTFKLWALPYVGYSVSESFLLNVGYEMEADHMYGKPTFDFTSYETDLQPGFIWNISSRLSINPYVQLFTGEKVSFDHAAMGAFINATLL